MLFAWFIYCASKAARILQKSLLASNTKKGARQYPFSTQNPMPVTMVTKYQKLWLLCNSNFNEYTVVVWNYCVNSVRNEVREKYNCKALEKNNLLCNAKVCFAFRNSHKLYSLKRLIIFTRNWVWYFVVGISRSHHHALNGRLCLRPSSKVWRGISVKIFDFSHRWSQF